VAKAKLANATAQKHRADELFSSQALTETEHDQAMLDYANAKAEVVTAQVQVENAKIQLEDTDVRAPISGTIIEKDVERGQVISSPTKGRGRGDGAAQDGRSQPGPGEDFGGRDRHRKSPTGSPGLNYG
jgi:hypothetical protein